MPPKASNNPAAQQKVYWAPHTFLSKTKPIRIRLTPQQPFQENSTISFQLQQAGLLNQLFFKLEFDLVISGTVTSGTWANLPSPAPFGLITGVTFGNNVNTSLRSLDGWTWYSWIRDRYAFDALSAGATLNYSGDVRTHLGGAGGTMPVPGANITAGTYHISIALPMPISYNRQGDTGLLVLPTAGLFYNLNISIGSIIAGLTATGGSSSIINTLVGTGLSYALNNVSMKCTQEYFMIPNDPEVQQGALSPFTSLFLSVTKSTQALIQGVNTWVAQPNDFITMLSIEQVNSGLHIGASNVTNIQWQYAGQQVDYNDDLDMQYLINTFNNRFLCMEGKILFDLGTRLGNVEHRDTYDSFNAQAVTGLQVNWTLGSGVTPTNPQQATIIVESLRQFQQAA